MADDQSLVDRARDAAASVTETAANVVAPEAEGSGPISAARRVAAGVTVHAEIGIGASSRL